MPNPGALQVVYEVFEPLCCFEKLRAKEPKWKGAPMIVVQHPNDSRSQRVLEELGLPYGIKHYSAMLPLKL